MNAKEMFEALCFSYYESKAIINWRSINNYIDFWKGLGHIKIHGLPIDVSVLKAINQQCKELGWLNE